LGCYNKYGGYLAIFFHVDSADMLKCEFSINIQRILSTGNAKCLLITNTKNFCITCAQVSMMVVSSDGYNGGYHCGNKEDWKNKLAPLGAPSKMGRSHVAWIARPLYV
jgi:hypothetical protein